MRILGIDPGLTGGIAILEIENGNARFLEVADLPVIGEKAKRRIDVHALRTIILRHRPIDRGFIERAQSFPGQGASSGFIYGRAVGSLEAVVQMCDVPLQTVEAAAWKKHFNLKGGPENKDAARLAALALMPELSGVLSRQKDHGRAEAVLICCYAFDVALATSRIC